MELNRIAAILVLCIQSELFVDCVHAGKRSSVTAKFRENVPGPGAYDDKAALDGQISGKVMMGYSDSWVVEIDGGKDQADKVAEDHGFVNLGQVCLV